MGTLAATAGSLFYLALMIVAACLFTLLGGYFLRRWLRRPRPRSLWQLAASAASLGVVCWLMYLFGEPYFYVLFLMAIWGTATLTAVVFLWRSRHMGRRRLLIAGLLLAVAYPALLLQMPDLYQSARRDEWDSCAAQLVLDALARYRSVAGRYPASFDDLYRAYPPPSFGAPPRPTYEPLDTIDGGRNMRCVVNRTTNSLCSTRGREYVFGYWRRYPIIGPLAARICLYRSDDPGWRCGWNDWGPFSAPSGR